MDALTISMHDLKDWIDKQRQRPMTLYDDTAWRALLDLVDDRIADHGRARVDNHRRTKQARYED